MSYGLRPYSVKFAFATRLRQTYPYRFSPSCIMKKKKETHSVSFFFLNLKEGEEPVR